MIYLKNYSQYDTFICLYENSYSVVGDAEKIDGIGGFAENDEMLGCYIENESFFFCYENNVYEFIVNDIRCTDEWDDNGKRNFRVIIANEVVCEIAYKPYASPLRLAFQEDDDEFDFLLFLSRALSDETTVAKFCERIKSLKKK